MDYGIQQTSSLHVGMVLASSLIGTCIFQPLGRLSRTDKRCCLFLATVDVNCTDLLVALSEAMGGGGGATRLGSGPQVDPTPGVNVSGREVNLSGRGVNLSGRGVNLSGRGVSVGAILLTTSGPVTG